MVNTFIEENGIINDEQCGFRHQHSTVHQVKRLTTGVVLMDIEKAFNSIWHNGLFHKKKYGFRLYIVKIIQSFLTCRSFKVVVNNTISSPRNIATLYSLLYVADFDNYCQRQTLECNCW